MKNTLIKVWFLPLNMLNVSSFGHLETSYSIRSYISVKNTAWSSLSAGVIGYRRFYGFTRKHLWRIFHIVVCGMMSSWLALRVELEGLCCKASHLFHLLFWHARPHRTLAIIKDPALPYVDINKWILMIFGVKSSFHTYKSLRNENSRTQKAFSGFDSGILKVTVPAVAASRIKWMATLVIIIWLVYTSCCGI